MSGDFAFAAGRNAQANHSNTFVWNDRATTFASTHTGQFLIRAANGVGINTNDTSNAALTVNGVLGII